MTCVASAKTQHTKQSTAGPRKTHSILSATTSTGFKWDGTPRLYLWLHHYLGAEVTDYTAGIGTMFMVAMVARIFGLDARLTT